MRVAGTVQDSIVDGPGLRFTLFTQGCIHNCNGCHNQETIPVDAGTEMSTGDVIKEMLRNPLTDGLTLSGGEPFLQAGDCAQIAEAAKGAGFNVWAYTGYTFEKLMEKAKQEQDIFDLLSIIDVLVDGPFMLDKRSLSIKWRGSTNQRILDVKKSIECGCAVDLEIN